MIKVVITHKDKDRETEYISFESTLCLLNYQLGLPTEELEEIEAFDVYIGGDSE